MHISSRLLGDLDVPLDRVLDFPEGLVGFPDRFRFARIPSGPQSPFESLISMDDPELAFSVGDPVRLVPGYAPPREEAAAALQAQLADVCFLALLVIPEDVRDTTINLSAPLAIDQRRRLGRQLLVADPNVDAAVRVFRIAR